MAMATAPTLDEAPAPITPMEPSGSCVVSSVLLPKNQPPAGPMLRVPLRTVEPNAECTTRAGSVVRTAASTSVLHTSQVHEPQQKHGHQRVGSAGREVQHVRLFALARAAAAAAFLRLARRRRVGDAYWLEKGRCGLRRPLIPPAVCARRSAALVSTTSYPPPVYGRSQAFQDAM